VLVTEFIPRYCAGWSQPFKLSDMSSDKITPDTWYTEIYPEGGSALSLHFRQKLHDEQTPYQRLEIYETESFGRLMTLDGLVMLTGRDNFIYHEMMTHPVLFTHPQPKRVLIIGGGDCGCLLETLKHDTVETAELVELDERVTRVSEQFFPELCTSNNDPRARLHFVDGIQWIADAADGSYDVIVIDSTDPVGPATGLFTEDFYRQCRRALAADGVLAAQSESPLFHSDIIKGMRAAMGAAGFPHVATLHYPQCTYPSGWWSTTVASKAVPLNEFRRFDPSGLPFATQYYDSGVHAGALSLPPFLRRHVENEA
jgi:spermidine synthase